MTSPASRRRSSSALGTSEWNQPTESRQCVLASEVLDDLHEHVHAAVRACIAGRPDDHRYTEATRGEQHVLQIMRLPGERTRRDVGAEGTGADVAGAGIGADQIRLGRDADLEAAGLDRCETQVPIGTDD